VQLQSNIKINTRQIKCGGVNRIEFAENSAHRNGIPGLTTAETFFAT
jgi:hypothetical protein